MATPIDRLPMSLNSDGPIDPSSVSSYADILKNMENDIQPPPPQEQQMPQQQMPQQQMPTPQHTFEQPSQQQHPQDHYLPPPMVNSRNNLYAPRPLQPKSILKKNTKYPNKFDTIQKDVIYIVILSIIVYSESTQKLISRFIPSLYKESQSTVLSLLFNGLLIAGSYTLLKNVSINLGN